ncbi:MAG: DUF1801 domain-containing protein [Leadbetterella sp.]
MSFSVEINSYIQLHEISKQEILQKMLELASKSLPEGFELVIQYKMPTFVVPHSIFPQGYHCKPSDPLPFLSFAVQKSHFAVYHMGIYVMPDLLSWFESEYQKRNIKTLDMGKSCIRFAYTQDIPFDLMAELFSKTTVDQWIQVYLSTLKK